MTRSQVSHMCAQVHTHTRTHIHTHTPPHPCMYTHTHTQTHTYMLAHMCTHIHVHTHMCTHTNTHTHTHTVCTHTHTCKHVHTFICTHTICTHTHTHTYLHTHTHTHKHSGRVETEQLAMALHSGIERLCVWIHFMQQPFHLSRKHQDGWPGTWPLWFRWKSILHVYKCAIIQETKAAEKTTTTIVLEKFCNTSAYDKE